jgi:hypothetical protein
MPGNPVQSTDMISNPAQVSLTRVNVRDVSKRSATGGTGNTNSTTAKTRATALALKNNI